MAVINSCPFVEVTAIAGFPHKKLKNFPVSPCEFRVSQERLKEFPPWKCFEIGKSAKVNYETFTA